MQDFFYFFPPPIRNLYEDEVYIWRETSFLLHFALVQSPVWVMWGGESDASSCVEMKWGDRMPDRRTDRFWFHVFISDSSLAKIGGKWLYQKKSLLLRRSPINLEGRESNKLALFPAMQKKINYRSRPKIKIKCGHNQTTKVVMNEMYLAFTQ